MGAIAAQLWLFKYLLLLSSTPLHKGAYHAVREDDQVIVKVVRLSPSCERVAKYEGSEAPCPSFILHRTTTSPFWFGGNTLLTLIQPVDFPLGES